MSAEPFHPAASCGRVQHLKHSEEEANYETSGLLALASTRAPGKSGPSTRLGAAASHPVSKVFPSSDTDRKEMRDWCTCMESPIWDVLKCRAVLLLRAKESGAGDQPAVHDHQPQLPVHAKVHPLAAETCSRSPYLQLRCQLQLSLAGCEFAALRSP